MRQSGIRLVGEFKRCEYWSMTGSLPLSKIDWIGGRPISLRDFVCAVWM